MGNCESNCFTYYNPQGAVTIPGNNYSNCGSSPSILNISFNPVTYGNNGSTDVILSDNSGNGANIATLVFSNNITSQVIPNTGVSTSRDADENIELTLIGSKIQGLTAGKDYVIGDTYKIRIPENAFCTGNQNGAFMVFSRGSGNINHTLAVVNAKRQIKNFNRGVSFARGAVVKGLDCDNPMNYAAYFALIAMIILVLYIVVMKRK